MFNFVILIPLSDCIYFQSDVAPDIQNEKKNIFQKTSDVETLSYFEKFVETVSRLMFQ